MEVMPIPCPHFKITIVKRSQGQSAVAGAAYQSGERLFSEYDQKTKFYNKKKELVHAEIMLPSYAPPGFADRQILWNAVEAVENQWNSQLARRIVLAFPVEVPKEQYLSMIKEFCQEQFVSKGMIADFAICNELFTWADVYDTANHDERRAILQQFIKEIRVRKDYEISITLNASFNQVEQLKAVSTYDGAEIFEEISEKGA